jgi:hypothetical protein
MGIIASLAAIVIAAVNPSKMLLKAQDVKRDNARNQLQKAFTQYIIDKGDTALSAITTTPQEICQGTPSGSCVNVNIGNLLAPTYLAQLPVDSCVSDADTANTGYKVSKEANGRIVVDAEFKGIAANDPLCTTAVVVATTWNGSNWSNGTPISLSDVIIAGNLEWTSALPSTINSLTITSGTLTVDTVYAGQGSFNALSITNNLAVNGGTITQQTNPPGNTAVYKLTLNVGGNATISGGGSIQVTGKGFAGATTDGANGYGSAGGVGSTSGGAGGGGHGGKGGDGNAGGAGGGPDADSATVPFFLGSGGASGRQMNYSNGGAGGGAIFLSVTGTLTNAGSIQANGNPASSGMIPGGAGGAGGSIHIKSAAIAGNGTLSAVGGSGTAGGGSGGGGRISITNLTGNRPNATGWTAPTNSSVAGGASGWSIGATGTLNIPSI